jgi:predicted amidohydrolase
MTRSIRVAAVQLRAHDRADFPRMTDAIVAAAEEATAGAELVVLPEATFPGYVLGHAAVDDAPITEAIERLAALARRTRTVIVAGTAVRDGQALRNAAIVFDRDGTMAGRADKLFLWHFDRKWFESGERLAPIETSIGTLGVLICADGRIPTIARTLVDRGAELLVMPTAWVTSGRNPAALENVQADLLAQVRAYENGVPFIAANKCGYELGMVAYCGKSQVVDANGAIVAIGSQREPETVKAVIEIGDPHPYRVKLTEPSPRATAAAGPVRIVISIEPLPADIDLRLGLLDADFAIAPGEADRLTTLDRIVPTASISDEIAFDPGGLVAYRRAGYRLAIWTVQQSSLMLERIARARALELRMYIVVLDAAGRRAFAVDPDGTIVCGTFDGFRLAGFSLDPRRTTETAVAPNTDIADGLERIAALARREEAATP